MRSAVRKIKKKCFLKICCCSPQFCSYLSSPRPGGEGASEEVEGASEGDLAAGAAAAGVAVGEDGLGPDQAPAPDQVR